MKISKGTANGATCWILNYKQGKKYRRKYFVNRLAAEAEIRRLEIDQRNLGVVFAAMSPNERIEWGLLKQRLDNAGATLHAAVEFFFAHQPTAKPPPLGEAITAAVAASKGEDSVDFHNNYKQIMARFLLEREELRVCDVKHEDIFGFLSNPNWKASTRNGYITRFQKFFAYCTARGWLVMNPMKAIKGFKESDKTPPAIFTVEQSRCLLHAAQRTNNSLGMLPYFALGLFCGLRPKFELREMKWENVFLDENFVAVDSATSKGERHRNVTLPPCAVAFLRLGGRLPVGAVSFVVKKRKLMLIEANRIAKERGVKPLEWAQDVMRHTFASHHYNRPGATAETTKREMGHSRASNELFDHYQARVRPAEAAAFWKIKAE